VNGSNSWASPQDSQIVTINEDDTVERYKIWHEPNSSSDRYVRIVIPNQTPTDGASYFRIARIIVPQVVFAPSYNIEWGYPSGASREKRRNEFLSGGFEVIRLGEDLLWQGDITWGYYPTDSLSDLHTLSARLEDDLALYYENIDNDTSKAYCVEKQGVITLDRAGYNNNKLSTISLQEKA
jgi:hypothetical protein